MSARSTATSFFEGSSTTRTCRMRELAAKSFADFWNPSRTFKRTFVAPCIGGDVQAVSHLPIPSRLEVPGRPRVVVRDVERQVVLLEPIPVVDQVAARLRRGDVQAPLARRLTARRRRRPNRKSRRPRRGNGDRVQWTIPTSLTPGPRRPRPTRSGPSHGRRTPSDTILSELLPDPRCPRATPGTTLLRPNRRSS